jgi:hypothetical protein
VLNVQAWLSRNFLLVLSDLCGFTMSGQGQADCLASANEASAEQPAVNTDAVHADAPRGWWIVPCVALGAVFWALIISWAFGSG